MGEFQDLPYFSPIFDVKPLFFRAICLYGTIVKSGLEGA